MVYRKVVYEGETMRALLLRIKEIEERKEHIRTFVIECDEEEKRKYGEKNE